jgi:hypothetical protein
MTDQRSVAGLGILIRNIGTTSGIPGMKQSKAEVGVLRVVERTTF